MSEYVVRIGGREYRAVVKELTPDQAAVEVDGTLYRVDLVQLGRRTPAQQVGRPAAAAAAAPAAARATLPHSEGVIAAPMPGLVIALKVREGERVQAGQVLLLMEAMKMENAVTAPFAGTVARVHVREGDSVGEGDRLLEVARPKLTAL
jgi:biotin carboxyl carrier protein